MSVLEIEALFALLPIFRVTAAINAHPQTETIDFEDSLAPYSQCTVAILSTQLNPNKLQVQRSYEVSTKDSFPTVRLLMKYIPTPTWGISMQCDRQNYDIVGPEDFQSFGSIKNVTVAKYPRNKNGCNVLVYLDHHCVKLYGNLCQN